MIGLFTGLFMRGHRPPRRERPILRMLGWVLLALLVLAALVGAVVLVVCPVC